MWFLHCYTTTNINMLSLKCWIYCSVVQEYYAKYVFTENRTFVHPVYHRIVLPFYKPTQPKLECCRLDAKAPLKIVVCYTRTACSILQHSSRLTCRIVSDMATWPLRLSFLLTAAWVTNILFCLSNILNIHLLTLFFRFLCASFRIQMPFSRY